MRVMKVLITGATGFIGREIVSEFIENDHQVIALGKSQQSSGGTSGGTSPNVIFYQANITVYKNLRALESIEGIEVMIHSAGLAHQFGETRRTEFEAVNVTGTENILNLAVKLRVKHFILIGSTAVYGIGSMPPQNVRQKNPTIIVEESTTAPQTLYAESKLKSEEICRRICEENNIALTIFRLAPVIGEANVGNVARLIGAIDKNRFIWIGNGANLKALIYKRDVARACVLLAANKQNKTEIFNLAAEPVKMKDFVGEIAARLDKKVFPMTIPESFLRMFFKANAKTFKLKKINKISETVEKWLSDDIYSADKIARVYGYKPATTISEAIAKQVDYYKTNKKRATGKQ